MRSMPVSGKECKAASGQRHSSGTAPMKHDELMRSRGGGGPTVWRPVNGRQEWEGGGTYPMSVSPACTTREADG